jgi:hypothetical protein
MAELSVESVRAEEGSYMEFIVRLSEPAPSNVTVDYQTYDGTALGNVDYNETSGTIEFEAGEITQTITVFARSDTLLEADKYLELELSNPVGADFGPRDLGLRAVGWVLDNEAGGGQRRVAVSTPVVTEGTGKADFVISLSEAFAAPTTLNFATIGGSALPGQDFVPRTGEVSFAAGQTEAIVSVNVKNDRKVEADESFGLTVEGSGIAATGKARILDGDGSTPILSVDGGQAGEGDYMTFTVRLSQPAPADVTVGYRTFDGTALGNVDYNVTDGTLEFLAGETTKTISVFVRSDSLPETDEALQLELFNAVGAGFGGRNQSLRATGWALDDDAGGGQRAIAVSSPIVSEGKGTAEFTVSLSEAFSQETTLRFATVDGSGRARSDFVRDFGKLTFAPGQTEAVVLIDLKNDRKAEAGESFGLKVTGAGLAGVGEATLLNDDGGRRILSVEGDASHEGDYLPFTVRLSKASQSEVTVDYRTVSGTALADTDFNSTDGTLTFAPGETVKTVWVFARSDSLSEPDEAFRFELATPAGAGFAKGDLTPHALGFVLDDDPGFQKRVLAVSDVRVSEAGGDADFVIALSQPLDDDLVIRYATQNGSAKAGKDFVGDRGTVRISAGATEAVVSIKLKNDGRDEKLELETFKLKLTAFDHDGFAPSGLDTQATATIVDDDPARGRLLAHEDMLL